MTPESILPIAMISSYLLFMENRPKIWRSSQAGQSWPLPEHIGMKLRLGSQVYSAGSGSSYGW